MANKNLTYQIFGKDRSASKTMSTVAANAARVGRRIAAVGAAIVAAMTVIVAKFAITSVQAAADAEKAQNRLALAWSKSARTNDVALASLQDYNAELQKTTKYDDDVIASAQAVLTNFKLTGQQIRQMTPALLDYAARTGKDLPTAAADLGKALMGQGRALKAIGIDFKATGDITKDYSTLMALLGQQVGGFAANEATTLEGKLAILKNRFGEIQERVGGALIEPLMMLAGFIDTNLMPKLEEFGDWFATEAPGALQKLAPFIEEMTPLVEELGNQFSDPEFRAALMEFVTVGLPALTQLLIAIIPLIPLLAGGITTVLVPAVQSLSFSITGVSAILTGNINDMRAWLRQITAAKGPIGDLANFSVDVWVKAVNGLTRMFNAFAAGVENLVNSLTGLTGIKLKLPRIGNLTRENVLGQKFTPSGSKPVNVPGAVAGRFAEGGIVPARPGGWLANVGEGGQAEAIIPLDRLGGLGGGGDTFQIHVTGYVGDENKLVQKLAKAVQDAKSRGAVPRGAFS